MARNQNTRTPWATALACIAFLVLSPARSAPVNDCDAYAGSITTDSTQQCLVNGSVTLVAVPGGDAVIPAGYQVGYILTSTNGLVIEQIGPDPAFTVSGVNIWRIHSIVYDPTTLDFNSILDYDYAYQLVYQLVQGGGSICANLDAGGAGTKTTECPDGCEADAGTISALNPDQCLLDGAAQLEALPDGNTVVPAGYSVLHVLTTGPDLLILAVGAEPSFTVDAEGLFTIHTLVYDPATLDLSGIVFGETSGFEIAALLQQGGGPICGSLDAAGAQFQVADCTPICEAFAGTLTPVDSEVCLVDGIATLDAIPNGDAVIPDGYSVAYIFIRPNGIIENVEPITLFEWPLTGEYSIHTLVYDPFTLNPFEVQLGTTNVSEINEVLIQGGGTVCGSLDLVGAMFTVIQCAPPCEEYAGIGGDVILCYTDAPVELFSLLTGNPDAGGSWTGPDGQAASGTFVPASGAQGVYIYFVSDGPDCPGDTAQLVMNLIECGDPCNAFAGNDSSVSVCANEAAFDLFALLGDGAWTGGTWTSPGGQPHASVFIPGIDAPGAYVYSVGDIEPCPGDEAIVNVAVVLPPNAGMDGAVTFCSAGPPVNLDGDGGSWFAPNGEPHPPIFSPSTDAAGVYTYVVEGTAPCVNDTATLTVSLSIAPNAGASATITVCGSEAPFNCSAELGGDPDQNGMWTGPNGAIFSGTFDPAVDEPGVYTYTVAGTAPCADDVATLVIIVQACCDAGENAEVTVCFIDPPFSMIDALGGDPCPGGSWTDPANQAHSNIFVPGVDDAGVYTYTVPGAPGEQALVATLTISVFECPNACDGAAGEDVAVEVCNDGLMTYLFPLIGGSPVPGGTWIWLSFGNINPEINNGYYDSMISGGGLVGYIASAGPDCAPDTAFIEVTEIECTDPCAGSTPDAGIGGDILRCDNDPAVDLFELLQGTPDVGGSWAAPDGNAFSGLFDPASSAPGVYVYTVFDLLDCEPDTAQINISVIDCPEANVQLVAWPNPAVTQVRVRFPAVLSGSAAIDIIDALGRSVRPVISITGDLITVDVSAMPAGTYTLRAFDSGKSHTGRFARARD